jgi:transcription factor STE12
MNAIGKSVWSPQDWSSTNSRLDTLPFSSSGSSFADGLSPTSSYPFSFHNHNHGIGLMSSPQPRPTHISCASPMQGRVVPRFDSPAADLIFRENLTRPLSAQEKENFIHLDELKFFLATAPTRWSSTNPGSINKNNSFSNSPGSSHPSMNRFPLPSAEHVTCVSWDNRYYITGTDIVRALIFRFEAFGRPVRNIKKFEEGIFSSLRNLKPGVDACLEEPKVSAILVVRLFVISCALVTISGSSFQVSVHTHS